MFEALTDAQTLPHIQNCYYASQNPFRTYRDHQQNAHNLELATLVSQIILLQSSQ